MSDHYAKEAARLRSDETLLAAIAVAQRNAMGELVTVEATDITAILRLQAQVRAFDEVLDVLEAAVLALPTSDQPAP